MFFILREETAKEDRIWLQVLIFNQVLLANINPDGGLVNGTQGEIVSFVDAREWPAIELTGNHKEWRQELINQFEAKNSIRPIVRFANGATKAIQCVAASELRGDYTDRFVVCRTQIPLALAWALSSTSSFLVHFKPANVLRRRRYTAKTDTIQSTKAKA